MSHILGVYVYRVRNLLKFEKMQKDPADSKLSTLPSHENDMMPILPYYFAWNYKIEILIENGDSNHEQIRQYDFLSICNSKNYWFSQWTREELFSQARFKTQTYIYEIPLNFFLTSVLIWISLLLKGKYTFYSTLNIVLLLAKNCCSQ